MSPCAPVATVALPQFRHGGAGDHTIQVPAFRARVKATRLAGTPWLVALRVAGALPNSSGR